MQSLTYQTILKPLLINFNYLLQYMRKSIQRKYKPFLQTNNSIKEIITITTAAAVPPYITVTKKDHIALYIIGKDITYKNIPKRSKKSLKLSLKISLRTAFRSK